MRTVLLAEVEESDRDVAAVWVAVSNLEILKDASREGLNALIDARMKLARATLVDVIERKTGRKL